MSHNQKLSSSSKTRGVTLSSSPCKLCTLGPKVHIRSTQIGPATLRHVIRNRSENRKSRFSLKPVGMAELKVSAVNRNLNRDWKKEKFFS